MASRFYVSKFFSTIRLSDFPPNEHLKGVRYRYEPTKGYRYQLQPDELVDSLPPLDLEKLRERLGDQPPP